MLRLLTDSHVPPAVSVAARKLTSLQILSLREWHEGRHLHETDPILLSLACDESLTIVTYDIRTFPLHVKARLESGLDHTGIIYVPASFRQNDVGRIAKALAKVWKERGSEDWTNQIHFLERD